MYSVLCTSHLKLPAPHPPLLGGTQDKLGVFTLFSLDLGFLVVRECTFFRSGFQCFTMQRPSGGLAGISLVVRKPLYKTGSKLHIRRKHGSLTTDEGDMI